MSSSFRRGPSSSSATAPPEMAGPIKTASLASLGGSTLGGDLTESAHADPNEMTDDSLEIMREIVMRIRNDPEFAASIYADCPRLQHLLEQRPDLRPIFEDPNLVRINFEQVYRDAGGKLPEDEEAEKEQAKSRVAGFRAILVKVVNHPLFKVLRFLLLIKKIVTCFTGGGMSMVRGLFQHLCCSGAVDAVGSHPDGSGGGGPDAQAHHGGIDGSPDGPDASNNAATKAALDKVATHMEDPEVQAQMQDLLQNDPDGLQDAINNDPELSALRDSNPLCAELMKDPDTMKILVDPDNLRALGDCPDLIEQDFADPDWSPPDLEAGGVGAGGGHGLDMMGGGGGGHDMIDLDLDNPDGGGTDVVEIDLDGDGQVDGIDVDGDGQVDGAVPTDASGAAAGGGGGGDNVLQDYELGDSNNNDGGGAARSMGGGGGGNKGRGAKGPNQARSGFISSVGAGFTDLIAQQVVGVGFSDLMPTLGGDVTDALGLDGLDGIDDGGAADSADQAASAGQAAAATGQFAAVSSAVQGGDNFFSNYGDQLDTLERGMDDIEEQADAFAAGSSAGGAAASAGAHGGQMAGAAAMGVSAAEGAIIGTAFMGNDDKQRGGPGHVNRGVAGTIPEDEPIIMVDDGDDEPEEKKKRFGWFGELGSALATAAKESIASAVLGDDLGELLVEKQEERKEEKEKEKEREKNASKRDLNASLSESMSGSRSNLNGSIGDMNRSKSSLGPSSPLGKKASKRL